MTNDIKARPIPAYRDIGHMVPVDKLTAIEFLIWEYTPHGPECDVFPDHLQAALDQAAREAVEDYEKQKRASRLSYLNWAMSHDSTFDPPTNTQED